MKFIFFLVQICIGLFFVSCSKSGGNDRLIVKDFEIICEQSALDSIYKNYSVNTYIPVIFIANGDSVNARMRLRGDTSREYGKKSLKIEFQKDSCPKGEGRKINLNSEWTDKSYVRQYISAHLMQKAGVAAYNTAMVRLKLNGRFWGIYLQVENIDKDFLKRNKLDTKGNLYKATKDGASLSRFDDIKVKWEKKSNVKADWNDLQLLINQLDTIPLAAYKNFLVQNFEYDKLLSLVALNMLLQNGSTYYHNYYLYHDINGTGKWQLMPWDMDKTMSFYNYKPFKYHETSSNWESDNPLIEKMFLSDETMTDLKVKIKYLSKHIFNNRNIDPIFNACKQMLRESVNQDQTDQIENTDQWLSALKKEKKFVAQQANYILDQLNNYPRSFVLANDIKAEGEIVELFWSASTANKPVKYKLVYGTHFLLEDEQTKTIDNINDTVCMLQGLKPGKYYWRVYATDGEQVTEGYNTKNIFEVLPEQKIIITHDTVFTKENSPHLIDYTLLIDKGVTLTIEPGCKLILGDNGTIENNGTLRAIGTSADSICFEAKEDGWNAIKNFGAESLLDLKYCSFSDGFIHGFGAHIRICNSHISFKKKRLLINGERVSMMWADKGIIEIDSCYFKNYKLSTGEGINIHQAQIMISNSTFDNMADAIEIINADNGKITGNLVMHSPDDAIDMNGCSNIEISNNILINNSDKAISIGTEQFGPSCKIVVTNNFIIGNGIGISVKDSSNCTISNCTFARNKVALNAYLKNNVNKYTIGGHILANSLVFAENKQNVKLGEASEVVISNSIFDKDKYNGESNIEKIVKFDNADKSNFNSQEKVGAKFHEKIIERLK